MGDGGAENFRQHQLVQRGNQGRPDDQQQGDYCHQQHHMGGLGSFFQKFHGAGRVGLNLSEQEKIRPENN